MTAEKLHDAISLLPADLVAEADRLRRGKPRVILWKRYAAMAACFALVLGCGMFAMSVFAPKGATETAMEAPAAAAPMEQAAMDAPAAEAAPEEVPKEMTGNGGSAEDSAGPLPAAPEPEKGARNINDIPQHRVETPLEPTTACFSSEPQVTLVTSHEELEDYLTDKDWMYEFTALAAACEAYGEDWFAEHDLLLLTVPAAYPDVPYAVTAVESTGGNDPMGWDWFVFYATAAESHPEGETTCLHLLTELEKGQIAPEDSILTIADPIS